MPPERHFRSNAAELFLSNKISALDAGRLFESAGAAGTRFISDLSRKSRGSHLEKPHKNLSRDITRGLLKHCQWPDLYYLQVPCFDNAKQVETNMMVPMLLPHELLASIVARNGGPHKLLKTEGMDEDTRRHLEAAKAKMIASSLREDINPIAVGCWVDGVPFTIETAVNLWKCLV